MLTNTAKATPRHDQESGQGNLHPDDFAGAELGSDRARLAQETLISPKQLEEMLTKSSDVVVIDTSPPDVFAKGHIPGAINMHEFWQYRSLEEAGGLDEMLTFFSKLLAQKGLRDGESIVFTEASPSEGFGQSARALLMTLYLGCDRDRLYLLDGGNHQWQEDGYNLSTGVTCRTPSREFMPHGCSLSPFITKKETLFALKRGAKLIDVRNEEEFAGEEGAPYPVIEGNPPREIQISPGRIPGAIGMLWTDVFDWGSAAKVRSRFKSPERLHELFMAADLERSDEIVVYCFKGARASAVYYALELAGYENPKIYFGGWNEWARNNEAPKETGLPDDTLCFSPLHKQYVRALRTYESSPSTI